MGLTYKSTGLDALTEMYKVDKKEGQYVVALAGNPNTGKSTVFNSLTGLHQHTGNWPGKTVSNARGEFKYEDKEFIVVDLPGTYSLFASSVEEEVARDFICFGNSDVIIVVTDATCLERNLNLVYQVMEINDNIILCVNLIDEAKKKNIIVDGDKLERELGIPVVLSAARNRIGINELKDAINKVALGKIQPKPKKVIYEEYVEKMIKNMGEFINAAFQDDTLTTIRKVIPPSFIGGGDYLNMQTTVRVKSASEVVKISIEDDALNEKIDNINLRWLSLRLIDGDKGIINTILTTIPSSSIDGVDYLNMQTYVGVKSSSEGVNNSIEADALKQISENKKSVLLNKAEEIRGNIDKNQIREDITSRIYNKAEETRDKCVKEDENKINRDRKIDKYITSRIFGIPIMLGVLAMVLWITVAGANVPSKMIADMLFKFEEVLTKWFVRVDAPNWLHGVIVLGLYRTLAWVVSVMLPPMAIFFPLFTILEDLGYLPRVAFNLDHLFKKACTHGKQCLTMCMGLGCNAAGIIGCRIIDSPRERLIAILTNNFVPCNGRFPTLIAISSVFLLANAKTGFSNLLPALAVTIMVVIGIGITLLVSYILSKTLLKGVPSSFTLELPPYRKPQIGRVIYSSIIDRTIFVLGRALVVAAPAGALTWLLGNIFIGDLSIISHVANFLDPLSKLIGLDGYILMAFILGLPANEIVLPILLMSYLSTGSMIEFESIDSLRQILLQHGWTYLTALNVMLFSLLHWPCATALLTIRKETGSRKWTLLAAAIPTTIAFIVCFVTATIAKLF